MRVLIVGAGPAGLAVSWFLRNFGIEHDIVDRNGAAGGAYARMYPAMRLSSPPRHLGLPGMPPTFDRTGVSAGAYAAYLKEYAAGVKITRGTVTDLQGTAGNFVVVIDGGQPTAAYSAIVVCTGMFDNPYMPTIAGLTIAPASAGITVTHAAYWPGPGPFVGSRLLIVGGGMTAIELAEECVETGIEPLTMSCRRLDGLTFPQRVFGVDPRHLVLSNHACSAVGVVSTTVFQRLETSWDRSWISRIP